MNIDRPVSNVMTKDLKTVNPTDSLRTVKKIMEFYDIHHVPVTDEGMVVGIISKTDLNRFISGKSRTEISDTSQISRLESVTAEEAMTNELIFISSGESIRRALELFRNNFFHALPIVDDRKLVGIITTFDICDLLLYEQTVAHKFFEAEKSVDSNLS